MDYSIGSSTSVIVLSFSNVFCCHFKVDLSVVLCKVKNLMEDLEEEVSCALKLVAIAHTFTIRSRKTRQQILT